MAGQRAEKRPVRHGIAVEPREEELLEPLFDRAGGPTYCYSIHSGIRLHREKKIPANASNPKDQAGRAPYLERVF
jgi:hypothetical protein